MSRFYSYLGTAQKIIGNYAKGEPLHLHLRQFFSKEKKYGSRDRKIIGDLCYSYYRCFHLFKQELSLEEKLIQSALLCGHDASAVVKALRPEWETVVAQQLKDKLALLSFEDNLHFPFPFLLSNAIDERLFVQSLLVQPDLFLRLRPGKEDQAMAKLQQANLAFETLSRSSLRLPSGSKLDEHLKINKEAVVQDLSSQQVLDKAVALLPDRERFSSWDVCAASGGKSILLFDKLKGRLSITVSDIRENILRNLLLRMGEAGINIHREFTADVSKNVPLDAAERFDIILCDVPCTGSGTWARTPEQLYSFDENDVGKMAQLQAEIVKHAQPFLADDGLLVYITCSVFELENEKNVEAICRMSGWHCLHMEYVKGFETAADTMFYALLKK